MVVPIPVDGLTESFLEPLFVKVRESGSIRNKAVNLAPGVNLNGDKELLGLWIE